MISQLTSLVEDYGPSSLLLLLILGPCLYYLQNFLRFHLPIKVECWFCMKRNTVTFVRRNAFTCSHCLQYNGFTKSGTYNRPIPEQHYNPNSPSYCQINHHHHQSKTLYETHHLCDACNQQEAMKLNLITNFIPEIEANYNQEIRAFRRQLEADYPLCSQCIQLIERVLPVRLKGSSSRPIRRKLYSVDCDSEDEDEHEHDSAKLKQRLTCIGKQMLTVGLPLLLYLSIAGLLGTLIHLSSHSFIEVQAPSRSTSKTKTSTSAFYTFKRSFSLYKTQLYEQYYLLAMFSISALYLALVCISGTSTRPLDAVVFSLLGALLANSFQYRVLSLDHDELVTFHQQCFGLLAVILTLKILLTCWNKFWNDSKNAHQNAINRHHLKPTRSEDVTTTNTTIIRQQIKDLSLSTLDENAEEKKPANKAKRSEANPFLNTNFDCTNSSRTPSPFSDKMLSSTHSFAYYHCQFSQSQSSPFSTSASSSSIKSSSISSSPFSTFPALTGNNKSAHLPYYSRPNLSPHQILNYYYVTYEQHQPKSKSSGSFLTTLFHTAQLTTFLLIIGLLVVTLSMSISTGYYYSSNFNVTSFVFSTENKETVVV